MNRVLVFDLDGTLVDSLPAIAGSLNRALLACGHDGHPHAAVRGFIGDGSRVLCQRALSADAAAASIDVLEAAFKADYAATWPQGTPVFDGVDALLEGLQARGFSLAVLSNKPHDFTTSIVAKLFPAATFDVVLGQRAGIPHKPAPDGVREIMRLTGATVDDCWLIGDSTIDLTTARNAGIKAMAVSWGYHDRDALLDHEPDAMADQPRDVLAYFSQP